MKVLLAEKNSEILQKLKDELEFDEFFEYKDFLGENVVFEDLEILAISKFFCGLDSNLISLIENLCRNGAKGSKIDVVAVFDEKMTYHIADEYFDKVGQKYRLKIKRIFEISEKEFLGLSETETILGRLKEILSGEISNDVHKTPELKKGVVTIYTDGACSGNPGAGGWGAVLFYGDKRKEISGFCKETTNNIMELTAVIESLKMLKTNCNVELYSDSAYVVNAINNGWLINWKQNGWLGSDKKPVKNQELWKTLDGLLGVHNVSFFKVKGHSDNEFNNRCDALATGEIARNTISIK